MTTQHEYAFDCNLRAVVRVRAEDERSARQALHELLDAADIDREFLAGYNSKAETVHVTEASITEEGTDLFERDGEAVEIPVHGDIRRRARSAIAAFRRAADGDSGDAEFEAACEVADVLETMLKGESA